MINLTRLAAALALAASATLAHAARVEFQLTGVVTAAMQDSTLPGTPVTGTLAYDAALPGAMFFEAWMYFWMDPSMAPPVLDLRIGDRHVTAGTLGAFVFPYDSEESIDFGGAALQIDGTPAEEASLRLVLANDLAPGDRRVLGDGQSLPTSFNVADYDRRMGVLFLDGSHERGVGFELTSITAVPEPSAVVAVLAGLAAMAVSGVATRRRDVARPFGGSGCTRP